MRRLREDLGPQRQLSHRFRVYVRILSGRFETSMIGNASVGNGFQRLILEQSSKVRKSEALAAPRTRLAWGMWPAKPLGHS
jgi:hypothetical protein